MRSSDALFVGDNFGEDICGAKGVGMDAAWLNFKKESEENLSPEPDYIITAFPDINAVLPNLK